MSKTTAPVTRRDTGLAWLVLFGVVILAALPLLIDLQRPATWSTLETTYIAISAETHNRKDPANEAETSMQAWTPVYEGVSRWDLPPGGIWLTQIMYLGQSANPEKAESFDDQAMIARARAGSVLMALLFTAAVYWAGHSIGGVTTGLFSALAAMTMPLVVGFGRHATPDITALAFSTLSIAGALWAMRPLRAAPSLARQLIGWLVCGIGLGLATLTAGPLAIPATLACTVALAMSCPRRLSYIMGLITSTAIATLIITPWVLHVHDQDPAVWRTWWDTLIPDFDRLGSTGVLKQAGWRIALATCLCGLWLVWLIPAVSQPFSTSSAGNPRRKMLLGWIWLVTATCLLAFKPGETRLSGLLIAAAPASLAIGLVLQQFHDLSAEARHARLWLICRWINAGIMILLAVALPLLGYLISYRPDLVEWLMLPGKPMLSAMHWSFYIGAALALLLVGVLAARFAYANHPGRSATCLAAWLIIAYTLATLPISRGPLFNTAANLDAEKRQATNLIARP